MTDEEKSPNVDILKTEIELFESIKQRLIDDGLLGQWVCIVGAKHLGTHAEAESAYSQGVQATKPGESFLVKQVLVEDLPVDLATFTFGALRAYV